MGDPKVKHAKVHRQVKQEVKQAEAELAKPFQAIDAESEKIANGTQNIIDNKLEPAKANQLEVMKQEGHEGKSDFRAGGTEAKDAAVDLGYGSLNAGIGVLNDAAGAGLVAKEAVVQGAKGAGDVALGVAEGGWVATEDGGKGIGAGAKGVLRGGEGALKDAGGGAVAGVEQGRKHGAKGFGFLGKALIGLHNKLDPEKKWDVVKAPGKDPAPERTSQKIFDSARENYAQAAGHFDDAHAHFADLRGDASQAAQPRLELAAEHFAAVKSAPDAGAQHFSDAAEAYQQAAEDFHNAGGKSVEAGRRLEHGSAKLLEASGHLAAATGITLGEGGLVVGASVGILGLQSLKIPVAAGELGLIAVGVAAGAAVLAERGGQKGASKLLLLSGQLALAAGNSIALDDQEKLYAIKEQGLQSQKELLHAIKKHPEIAADPRVQQALKALGVQASAQAQ